MRILIASPVRKQPEILRHFLASLARLDHSGHDITYCLADDNDHPASSALLRDFAEQRAAVFLTTPPHDDTPASTLDHYWTSPKIERVADLKNRMLRHFIDGGYDYIFLVDADLVLHPNTLKTLLNCQKDIVSEIFWTRWQPDAAEMPQVWLKDQYTLYDHHALTRSTATEVAAATAGFLSTLRRRGTYRVGGLGACTLISRAVAVSGVSFAPLYNLSFWGEDRAFCIRAVAHGFELFVNTDHPAFHIYRIEDLSRLPCYAAGTSHNTAQEVPQ